MNNKNEEREVFYLEVSTEGIESDVPNVNACPKIEGSDIHCNEDQVEEPCGRNHDVVPSERLHDPKLCIHP